MLYSSERILVTHVGSLPRPVALTNLMFMKEEGKEVEQNILESEIRAAVLETVKQQIEAGVDFISDGEMSKPSYATYIKDRLSGFRGANNTFVYQDIADFPSMAKRVFEDPGRSRRNTPACNSEITLKNIKASEIDTNNFLDATHSIGVAGKFMNAASPGVISLFFANTHYPNFESYIFAIADAMKHEYETITKKGLFLQVDCPDLAMGRHIQYANHDLSSFRNKAELHVEALNHALSNIPREMVRIHLCWGNYEGPHHCDVPLHDIIDIAFKVKASGVSFEAANPRHAHEYKIFDDITVPEGTVLIPGVIESKSNFIEHPDLIAQRIVRYAKRVGRENVIAGSDCGYATWVGQAAVEPEIVWAKLSAMAEGAKIASDALWT